MRLIRYLLLKAFMLPIEVWQALFLLMTGALVKAFTVVFFDMGSVALLGAENGFQHVGFDLIWGGALLALAGSFVLKLERQKGYGAAMITTGLLGMFTLGIWGAVMGHFPFMPDVLYTLRYPFTIMMSALFWTTAARFLPLRMDSLKFIGIFGIELLGAFGAGLMTALNTWQPETCLILAQGCLMVFLIVLGGLKRLAPVQKEAFVPKNGGVQDAFEKRLVFSILTLSFLYTLGHALADWVFYTAVAPEELISFLGAAWALYGGLGLSSLIFLYRTRYIYTTLAGMLVLSAALGVIGIFGEMQLPELLMGAYVIFMLSSYFYFQGYVQLLPRPLAYGRGRRVKETRLLISSPAGMVLAGTLLIQIPYAFDASAFLVGVGVLNTLTVWISSRLYANLLLRQIKMRVWRGGPLMIAARKVRRYLFNHVAVGTGDDAIYCLRIMEISNHVRFPKYVVRALKHPDEAVRLFALNRLGRLYTAAKYRPMIELVMKQDPSPQVQCAALALLIQIDADKKGIQKTVAQYADYLDNRRLKIGAMVGFFRIEGAATLMAMEVLQRLAQSKKPQDQSAALKVMAEAPNPGFVRLLMPLLKSTRPAVECQALLTAGAIRPPEALPDIFRALDRVETQEAALTALKQYGKSAFAPIEKMMMSHDAPLLRRKLLVLYLGALPSGEGKQILMRATDIDHLKLKKIILMNLVDSGLKWTRTHKEALRKSLKKDLAYIARLMAFRDKYHQAPTHESAEAFGFLMRALEETIDDARDVILYQLLLLHENALFEKAVRILLSASHAYYLPAMGVVQDLLPSRFYQKLKPVLVLPLEQNRESLTPPVSESEAVAALLELVKPEGYHLSPWATACALYCLRRLGDKAALPALYNMLTVKHPVVLEAAIWALVRLEPDAEKLHRALLKIPTAELTLTQVDSLLDS